MLETLISSKTRVKLLMKFFLNSNATSYLRGLEHDLGDSSNAIRLELNRFEKAGMLISYAKGNKKIFRANIDHPLFGEVHNILLKYVGLDQIVDSVISRLGQVRKVYVVGKLSQGLDSDIIDLVLLGDIDKAYLVQLIEKAEKLIKRKIRYLIYEDLAHESAFKKSFPSEPLLLWEA